MYFNLSLVCTIFLILDLFLSYIFILIPLYRLFNTKLHISDYNTQYLRWLLFFNSLSHSIVFHSFSSIVFFHIFFHYFIFSLLNVFSYVSFSPFCLYFPSMCFTVTSLFSLYGALLCIQICSVSSYG